MLCPRTVPSSWTWYTRVNPNAILGLLILTMVPVWPPPTKPLIRTRSPTANLAMRSLCHRPAKVRTHASHAFSAGSDGRRDRLDRLPVPAATPREEVSDRGRLCDEPGQQESDRGTEDDEAASAEVVGSCRVEHWRDLRSRSGHDSGARPIPGEVAFPREASVVAHTVGAWLPMTRST